MKKEAMSNNTQIAKVKSINKILKAILKKHNIIDILKIDVEGEEFKIIRSIYKKYLKKIKIINVEGKGFDKILPYYFKCTIQGSASRFVNSFLN